MPALKRRLEMRRQLEVFLVDLFVAGLTDVSTNVLGCVFLTCGAVLVGFAGNS